LGILIKNPVQATDITYMRIDPPRSNRVSLQEPEETSAIATHRFPKNTAEAPLLTAQLPALELGQEISGLVVRELADGRIALNLGGALIEANNPGGLVAGEALRLRVELLEPQIMLQIVAQEPTLEEETARLLRQHLPGPVAERDSLLTLQEKLTAGPDPRAGDAVQLRLEKLKSFIGNLLRSEEPIHSQRLVELVRDSGLQYEAKLFRALTDNPQSLAQVADGDLKGLLLGALKELETAALTGEPRNTILGQLNTLEGQQAVNLLAQIEGHAFQLQLPLFIGSGFATVALSIERDSQEACEPGTKKPQGYRILFLLDLENFGHTCIDTYVNANGLNVIFYVDQEGSVALLKRELPQFRDALKAMGYREVWLAARGMRQMTQDQEAKFNALAMGIPLSLNLLNVKV